MLYSRVEHIGLSPEGTLCAIRKLHTKDQEVVKKNLVYQNINSDDIDFCMYVYTYIHMWPHAF